MEGGYWKRRAEEMIKERDEALDRVAELECNMKIVKKYVGRYFSRREFPIQAGSEIVDLCQLLGFEHPGPGEW